MEASDATPPPSRTGVWARRTFASLRHGVYRKFFVGHLVSLTGFWMRITAQGVLVWELTHRKDTLGEITALGLLPFVVLAPFGGLFADRHDRRRLLLLTQTVAALSNALLGVAVLTGFVRLWHVAVIAVVVGSARAVEIPVRQALVQDLVGKEDRSNAIGLNAAGFQLARVVGPSLGAGVIALADQFGLGVGPCFLLVAACSLFNVTVLPGLAIEAERTHPETHGVWRQLGEGFRYVVGHRRTLTLLLLVFIAFVGLWPYQAFLPALADEVLDVGATGYALLVAVTGVGALLGALWVAGRSSTIPATRNVVFGLVWTGVACVAVVGVGHSWLSTVSGLLIAGFCQVAFVATANTMVQASAPDALRGRVMGIWTFVFGASYPLGAYVMGKVAQSRGTTWAFVGGGLFVLATTLAVRLLTPPRREPEPPAIAEVPPAPVEGPLP